MNHRLRPVFYLLSIAALCLFPAAASAAPALERLQGTWISDREGTVAWMRQSGRFESAYIERLAPLIGNLKVTYKGNTAILDSVSGGAARELLFRIVREDGNTVDIEAVLLPPEGQTVDWSKGYTSRIEIDDGVLWVSQPLDPSGLRERLVKAEPETSAPQSE